MIDAHSVIASDNTKSSLFCYERLKKIEEHMARVEFEPMPP